MTERVEQRYCIKFCQKLCDTQSETIRKFQQAFGNGAMVVTQIKEWFNRFKNGRTSVDSDQRTGRQSTSRNPDVINKVRSLIMEYRRLTVREIANDNGISDGSAHAILTDDLGMRKVPAKFVPKLLSCEQNELRLDVAHDMLECANNDLDFLKTVITGDESWVCGYDPETKAQSSQWKPRTSPRPKKTRQISKVKVVMTFLPPRSCASRIPTRSPNC
jgi:histone-lysine N-methyltransferase SETMAR